MTRFPRRATALAAALLLAFTPWAAPVASAQGISPRYCSPGDQVFYVNGVRTQFAEAVIEATLLQDELREVRTPDEGPVTVTLIYNRTAIPNFQAEVQRVSPTLAGRLWNRAAQAASNAKGSLKGVAEAVAQDFSLEQIDVLRAWAAESKAEYDRMRYERRVSPSRAAELVARLEAYIAAQALVVGEKVNELADSEEVASMTSRIRNAIDRGQRVVLVGFSQGNFFVNMAYRNLSAEEQRSVAAVGVATPAREVAGGGPHTTFETDRVVGAIRMASEASGFAAPLPANARNQSPSPTTLSHSFTADYMRDGSASRTKILGDIQAAFGRVTPSERIIGSGAITATLTWGDQPDVDLHVFEPGGAHVYYSAMNGQSGTLDRDDTNSWGPENYVVTCERVTFGTYRIGLNFFAGYQPETARVEIRTPDAQRQFEVRLDQARGFSGDQSPVPVVNITVTQEGEGVVRFAIDR